MTSDPAAYAKTYFMPNNHDKAVVSMRRWIHDKAGGGPKWGPAALARGLPPRLPAAQLFDVYESHTKNCKTCSSALRKARLLRNVSLALVGALVSGMHSMSCLAAARFALTSTLASIHAPSCSE